MRNYSYAFTFFTILIFGLPLTACHSQNLHPKKSEYKDVMDWPVTKPGDVELHNFNPFRAVYERSYTNGAGQSRTDRVIVTAEEVSWDGHEVIAISLTDTGDPEFDDTNARSLIMYAKRADLSILFEIGPRPGTSKDYYVGRNLGDKLILNSVVSDSDARDTQIMETSTPGFGPGTWVMANLDLSEGRKIRLDPMYSPRANAVTGYAPFAIVVGKQKFVYPDGSQHDAWILEHATNPTSATVTRRPVIGRPPYLLGTESVNLDTGERTTTMKLVEFQNLGGG